MKPRWYIPLLEDGRPMDSRTRPRQFAMTVNGWTGFLWNSQDDTKTVQARIFTVDGMLEEKAFTGEFAFPDGARWLCSQLGVPYVPLPKYRDCLGASIALQGFYQPAGEA